MAELSTVYLIDGDLQSRKYHCDLLELRGYDFQIVNNASEFLAGELPDEPGCLVFSTQSNIDDGLNLLSNLNDIDSPMPVLFISLPMTLPIAVEVMRAGALNYFFKPLVSEHLDRAIKEAFEINAHRRLLQAENREIAIGFEKLTNSEKRTLEMVILGQPNKVVAKSLNVSQRTVERTRSNIIKKLGAQSTADLVYRVTKYRTRCDQNRVAAKGPYYQHLTQSNTEAIT